MGILLFFIDDRSLNRAIRSIDNSIAREEERKGMVTGNKLELLQQLFKMATEKKKDDLVKLYPKSHFQVLVCPTIEKAKELMVLLTEDLNIQYGFHVIYP